MLDLETMSTRSDAAIISIGAVKFWLNVKQTEFTTDQLFYKAIDLTSSVEFGLHIDPETIKWWVQQGDTARNVLKTTNHLEATLNSFSFFVPENAYIFGNGATFDNVILRNAYRAVKRSYPVSYKYDVCYRTMCKLVDTPPIEKFEGTKHCAIDDAINQTKHLMRILERVPWKI